MRVLVIGDIHEPVSHPGYLPFCRDLAREVKPDKVLFIGDVVDFHGISFHSKNPDCPGPRDEAEQAYNAVQRWYKAFPEAEVMIGNHDERVLRLANSVGIPSRFIKGFSETWGTPGWHWKFETQVDGWRGTHGTGQSGLHPAFVLAKHSSMSTVIGHTHAAAGIQFFAGPRSILWGMDAACGIDHDAAAMAYGRHFARKPVLGAGWVIDGDPYWRRMRIAAGERYHRSRFKAKKQ